jgi:hypothetical protein
MSIAQELRLRALEQLVHELAERLAVAEAAIAKRDTLKLKKAPQA